MALILGVKHARSIKLAGEHSVSSSPHCTVGGGDSLLLETSAGGGGSLLDVLVGGTIWLVEFPPFWNLSLPHSVPLILALSAAA